MAASLVRESTMGVALLGLIACDRATPPEPDRAERTDVPVAAKNALGTRAASAKGSTWQVAPESPPAKPGFEPAPPASAQPEAEGIPL